MLPGLQIYKDSFNFQELGSMLTPSIARKVGPIRRKWWRWDSEIKTGVSLYSPERLLLTTSKIIGHSSGFGDSKRQPQWSLSESYFGKLGELFPLIRINCLVMASGSSGASLKAAMCMGVCVWRCVCVAVGGCVEERKIPHPTWNYPGDWKGHGILASDAFGLGVSMLSMDTAMQSGAPWELAAIQVTLISGLTITLKIYLHINSREPSRILGLRSIPWFDLQRALALENSSRLINIHSLCPPSVVVSCC